MSHNSSNAARALLAGPDVALGIAGGIIIAGFVFAVGFVMFIAATNVFGF